jgi:murein DD-endopeptidase MepM/ murein hydrolase activator NlpD
MPLYAHMGRIYVTKDQKVGENAIIGTVGLTGFTSGPHTHLEITLAGKYIDPLTILPPVDDQPKEEFLISAAH